MFLRGDEATRVAVDALVALVTGQDMDALEYRTNVWVWWTKVAVQYVTAVHVLRYAGSYVAKAVDAIPLWDVEQPEIQNEQVEARDLVVGHVVQAREVHEAV